jgi:anti-sigma regulatory factor (Ser/Thr protein kinase)
MERRFPRTFASLEAVFEFADGFLSAHDSSERVSYAIKLAVEELFTNMVKYNTGSDAGILIRMEVADERMRLRLIDDDVAPFDPASARDAGIDLPLAERTPGGLGLHLVRSTVDRIEYQYRDGRMTVTVEKEMGE